VLRGAAAGARERQDADPRRQLAHREPVQSAARRDFEPGHEHRLVTDVERAQHV
jgi:hypothetical protein